MQRLTMIIVGASALCLLAACSKPADRPAADAGAPAQATTSTPAAAPGSTVANLASKPLPFMATFKGKDQQAYTFGVTCGLVLSDEEGRQTNKGVTDKEKADLKTAQQHAKEATQYYGQILGKSPTDLQTDYMATMKVLPAADKDTLVKAEAEKDIIHNCIATLA
jgi:hypothetical protein